VLHPTKSSCDNLPRFVVLFLVFVEILIVFVVLVEFGVLVKLFIIKDFVVFVVELVGAGVHFGGLSAEIYSVGGLAAAAGGGAGAAAPGCVG